MDIAGATILLLAVAVGFALGRVPLRLPRRAVSELTHRPDPVTQIMPPDALDADELDWLEGVEIPTAIPVGAIPHPEDVVLRAAGFVIWGRPASGEPLWQDRCVRSRDTYRQSVALRIAQDRIMVQMRGRD